MVCASKRQDGSQARDRLSRQPAAFPPTFIAPFGSLLAGFEHLAARNAVEGASATQMATLPAVTVVARRAELVVPIRAPTHVFHRKTTRQTGNVAAKLCLSGGSALTHELLLDSQLHPSRVVFTVTYAPNGTLKHAKSPSL